MQLNPMKPVLKPPGSTLMKLKDMMDRLQFLLSNSTCAAATRTRISCANTQSGWGAAPRSCDTRRRRRIATRSTLTDEIQAGAGCVGGFEHS